jgi:hypothetical protein
MSKAPPNRETPYCPIAVIQQGYKAAMVREHDTIINHHPGGQKINTPVAHFSPIVKGIRNRLLMNPASLLTICGYGLRSNQGREGIVPPAHLPIAETEQTKCYHSLQQHG